MKKRCLTVILSGLISAGVFADTVNEASVTTFQAGTPAVAAEVNATIQALITAINDNATRISAIEDATSNDVTGRSYSLKQIGMMFRGNNTDYMTAGNYTQTYTLTLSGDMTFTLIGTNDEGEVGVDGATTLWENSTGVNETGTYSQSGNTVTLSFSGGSSAEFTVANNGSVILLSEFSYGVEADQQAYTRSESSLLVGVQTILY